MMKENQMRILALCGIISVAATACSGDDPPVPGNGNGNGQTAGQSVDEDCVPRDDDLETIQEGVLTVAQYDYPPFSMYDEATGELSGVEGEILSMFAEMQCLEISVVQGDSAAMITSVDTGRADTTLGSWYRTADRAEVVRLSEPVITSPQSIVSAEGIESIDDLVDLDVGIGQGNIAVEELQGLLGGNLNIYQNVDSVFADFQAGRLDAAVLGYGAAVAHLENRPIEGAEIMPIAPDERVSSTVDVGQTNFPVNLDNDDLGEVLDEVILELREEGTIEEIADEYGFSSDVADPGEPNLL